MISIGGRTLERELRNYTLIDKANSCGLKNKIKILTSEEDGKGEIRLVRGIDFDERDEVWRIYIPKNA